MSAVYKENNVSKADKPNANTSVNITGVINTFQLILVNNSGWYWWNPSVVALWGLWINKTDIMNATTPNVPAT